MADLDDLCDLLDEETEEIQHEENREGPSVDSEVDPDEAELLSMLEKVKEMKAKVAAKKKTKAPTIAEIDLFQKDPSPDKPSAGSPFIDKPNKPIKLFQKTQDFGPALPERKTRIITGDEKKELMNRITVADSKVVRNDLDMSSDEEDENPMKANYNECGKQIKKQLDDKQISSFLGNSQVGFNKIQGSSINLSNSSKNKKLPSNLLVEKNSKIRINNPIITQTQLDLNLINRSFISIYRLKNAISRNEMEGKDWTTMGVIFYKNSQTSKNGNTYTMWKMSDLSGAEPVIITVMLFGRAHAVHYKMPMNKVVGLLNPKVLESRSGGGSLATLSVDHPDKVMEMGDSLDVGRCKGNKHDGSICNNLVNLADCEFCSYHIKKAYKSMSAKRADIQSSFSGPGDARSRIMSKIAPKGEIFGGGQVLNQGMNHRAAKSNSKLIMKDTEALKTLGLIPSEINTQMKKQKAFTKAKLLTKTNESTLISESEKEVMKKVLNEGVSEDLATRLLVPSPGARVLLKHLTKNAEIEQEKEAVEKGSVKTAKFLISDHKKKLKREAEAQKTIEERKNLVQKSIASIPKIGRGFSSNDGFIDLGSSSSLSPSNDSKLKALLALKGKKLQKVNPNNVKRKRLSDEYIKSSKNKVAKVLNQQETNTTSNPERQILKGINGSVINEAKLEELKNMKSKNAILADEDEMIQRDKYFDVLEKKDAMEEKMVNTKEIEVKAVNCSECNYTAYAQSDLCKDRGHRVKFMTAKKRFFECAKCSSRTTSLEKYPKKTCDNCGNSGWKRAGMMKEKKAILEHEKLVIRGAEQKFIGAHTSSSKMNLDSIQ
uniref:Protein MCM10 homolog n=1 Tax=Lepeophtheirus salmonis TaxID=72036 RepID=A0A0K2VC38_LEPSM